MQCLIGMASVVLCLIKSRALAPRPAFIHLVQGFLFFDKFSVTKCLFSSSDRVKPIKILHRQLVPMPGTKKVFRMQLYSISCHRAIKGSPRVLNIDVFLIKLHAHMLPYLLFQYQDCFFLSPPSCTIPTCDIQQRNDMFSELQIDIYRTRITPLGMPLFYSPTRRN